MREVVIASAVRTPVGRAFKGTLRATRPDELAAIAIKGALDRVPQVDPKEIEDVILGCATPEAEQGSNVARIASLRAGLPLEVSAITINRFCSSGLQSIAMAAERIMSGGAEIIIAGGTESMSMIPMGGHKISPNPWLVEHYPDSYLTMGLTAERVAQRLGITRLSADEFSLRSHQNALAAIQAGKFEDETVPVPVSFTTPNGSKPKRQEIVFKVDEGPRADTSLEALQALKPVFHAKGTVTAGNASQTSDGAAAAVVMSAERAKALGITPSGALRIFCNCRLQARGDGARSGIRDPQSSEASRPEAIRHRRDRIERSFRGASAGRDQRSGAGSRASESKRRSHSTGASAGLHWREADRLDYSRNETAQVAIRDGDHVRRRRHGGGGDFREHLIG